MSTVVESLVAGVPQREDHLSLSFIYICYYPLRPTISTLHVTYFIFTPVPPPQTVQSPFLLNHLPLTLKVVPPVHPQ